MTTSQNPPNSIAKSIEFWNNKPFLEYKEFLDKTIKLNDKSSIFLYTHLKNFLFKYSSKLGYEQYLLQEQLFYLCIELKLHKEADFIIRKLLKDFGRENKLIRLLAESNEISPKGDVELSLEKYKELMLINQEDRISIKKYILFMKYSVKQDEMKNYIELWNEYLKVFMDDVEAWNELAEVYLSTNNYKDAIYCLEELLLHNPHNYKTYIKLGDIYASLNKVDSAKMAVKYYSQSLLTQLTPRALWGISHCLDIIKRNEKKLDEKMTKLLKITKYQIKEMYMNSPFKDVNLEMLFGELGSE